MATDKGKIRTDVLVLLILVILGPLPWLGRGRLIEKMDRQYVESTKNMQRHFEAMYLTAHLRYLSQQMNMQAGRYALWGNKEFFAPLDEISLQFHETLMNLQETYRHEGG